MKWPHIILIASLLSLACKDRTVNPSDILHYKLAFSLADSLGEVLATVNQDGTNLRVIHRLPGTSFFLRWAPNGSKILFDMYNVQLGVVNTDGTNFKLFGKGGATVASWFQDSERIAFAVYDTIYSVNVTTWVQEVIGRGNVPIISPTGDKIAFGRNSKLFIMNPDGSDETQLADSLSGGLAW